MGLGKNFAPLIFDLISKLETRCSIVTLGRITLDFDAVKANLMLDAAGFGAPLDEAAAFDDVSLFQAMGFSTVESLDYSDFEEASQVFDLNAEQLRSDLVEKFDVVFNAGTLEHVFRVDRGFANCLDMLRVGGVLISIAPMNNYVDHGFYQFSPTLFLDIASANHLDVLASVEVRLELNAQSQHAASTVRSVGPSDFGVVGALDDAPRLYVSVLRKVNASTPNNIPIQAYYRKIFSEEGEKTSDSLEQFTYRIEDGSVVKGSDFEAVTEPSEVSSSLSGSPISKPTKWFHRFWR